MEAIEASAEVVGFSMLNRSHITNFASSEKVRTCLHDFRIGRAHIANMARRGIPKGYVTWFLREWMAAKKIPKQADMMQLTGWSKATMSQLYNGTQDFSPKLLREAADALHIEPYELLLPPARAMSIREFQRQAFQVVESAGPAPATTADVIPMKSTGTK
jgi:hypothetical protein